MTSDPPGLALERTTMAWLRTALVLAVVALLFLRHRGPAVLTLALGGVAGAWALGLVQWLRHPLRARLFHAGSARPEVPAAAFVTAFVVLLALGGLAVVLL